jgi:hypothetical protein
MTLQAISSAATIALAITIVVLFAIKTWHFVARPFAHARNFPSNIMVESAQRFRDQLESLKGEQALYLMLTLMFLVTFGIAILLRPQDTYGKLPEWQNLLVLSIVVLGAAYGVFRFVRVIIKRRHVAFVRDANIAVGHSLQRLTTDQNRVYHEVVCATGIIDNVIVGLQGIYSVNVIAVRPGKDNRVKLNGEKMSFAPGKVSRSIADAGQKSKQLMKILQKQTGHKIRVRAVIAVPGWEIESQSSEDYLVVNERNLAMMRGWKNENDFLMNEDLEAINHYLTERNTVS